MTEIKFTRFQTIIGVCASLAILVIRATLRWEEQGLCDVNKEHWSTGESTILVFWHSQQLFMPWSYRRFGLGSKQKPIFAIASGHGDGRLAASLLERLSIKTISGSSTRNGARAMAKMRKYIRNGCHIAITPDGPTGPVEEAKIGAVMLASLTGATILPVAFNAKRKWVFNSWDKMFIPKPFSKTCLIAAERFKVDANLDRDQIMERSRELTLTLKEINSEVDKTLANA